MNRKSISGSIGLLTSFFGLLRTLENDLQRRNTLTQQSLDQKKQAARETDPEDFIRDGSAYPYEPGMIYLGRDGQGRDVGIRTKKHLITVGETRSGKDQCSILQNLIRHPSNFCVVDPKAEGADNTAIHRQEAFGHDCYVIDPCGVANVPDHMRVNFNPMAGLSPDDRFIHEKLSVISDGLILREGIKSDPFWKNAAEGVVKGVLAWQLARNPQATTLPMMKYLLALPGDPQDRPDPHDDDARDTIGALCAAMEADDHYLLAPLIREAPKYLYGKPGQSVLTELNVETEWVNYVSMRESLSSTSEDGEQSFSFDVLKKPGVTVYIVIPPDKLSEYARFLRLMITLAINAMAEGGDKTHETIFVMNEFYALGRLKKVDETAGLLPSAGVKFWPILQNWSQMVERYQGGADKYYGSCGVKEFMGVDDKMTEEFVSKQLGNNPISREPLMSPRQVKEHVAPVPIDVPGLAAGQPKPEIARRKLVFISQQDHVLSVRPRPFFLDR